MIRRLQLNSDGTEYSLDGRPVAPGSILEILLPHERWLRGRFERMEDDGSRDFVLRIALGGPWEVPNAGGQLVAPAEASMRLPRNTIARWPTDN